MRKFFKKFEKNLWILAKQLKKLYESGSNVEKSVNKSYRKFGENFWKLQSKFY